MSFDLSIAEEMGRYRSDFQAFVFFLRDPSAAVFTKVFKKYGKKPFVLQPDGCNPRFGLKFALCPDLFDPFLLLLQDKNLYVRIKIGRFQFFRRLYTPVAVYHKVIVTEFIYFNRREELHIFRRRGYLFAAEKFLPVASVNRPELLIQFMTFIDTPDNCRNFDNTESLVEYSVRFAFIECFIDAWYRFQDCNPDRITGETFIGLSLMVYDTV